MVSPMEKVPDRHCLTPLRLDRLCLDLSPPSTSGPVNTHRTAYDGYCYQPDTLTLSPGQWASGHICSELFCLSYSATVGGTTP